MVRTIFGGVSGAVVFGLLLLVQKITSLMFSALGGVPELAIISGLLVFGATGAILAHFVGD